MESDSLSLLLVALTFVFLVAKLYRTDYMA